MLKLYYLPGACSLVPHTALEWIGVDFDAQAVDHTIIKSPEYLALNPNGQVPLLQEGSWTLTQNVAILDYLNDVYPQAKLYGSGDARAVARAREWLAFLNADLHKDFSLIFGFEGAQRFLQFMIHNQPVGVDGISAQELTNFLGDDGVIVGEIVVQIDQPVGCDGGHRHRPQCFPGSVQFASVHSLDGPVDPAYTALYTPIYKRWGGYERCYTDNECDHERDHERR